MKTFMKWAGNKSSIIEKIAPCLVGETLIEPFAGSCAVSLNTNFKKYICNDINADMINMYQLIQKNPTEFIKLAQDFFLNGNEETRFYELRELYNNTPDKNLKSALFLYLNRHCFNGLCRYNSKGKFNVPFGKFKAPYFPEKEIIEFHDYTKNNFVFLNEDFSELFKQADENTVIYCDPPYEGTVKYKNGINHIEFWEWCRNKSKEGHTLFVSEYNAPNDFECVWQMELSNTLSKQNNFKSVEKLFKFSHTNVN
jgi:DNA adenine methylase